MNEHATSLVVFEHADRQAREFIADRIPHAIAWLNNAFEMATLPGDNVDHVVHALRMANIEFRSLRETAVDLVERRRAGA